MNPQELERQIIDLVRHASMEFATRDEELLPLLGNRLLIGTTVYVAHSPKSSVDDLVRISAQIESLGFNASPHIVARRLESERALRTLLCELQDAGVTRVLLVAGDLTKPLGPFQSTLDIIDTGLLEKNGMRRVGVAGHPEGHKAIGPTALWSALQRKQAYADRTGSDVHIVTQFALNPQGICDWCMHLRTRGITLPVRVGIAGPTSLPRLIRFAMHSGAGASLHALMQHMSAMSNVARVATSPGEMLIGLARGCAADDSLRIVAPHFFTFGGAISTANWIRAVANGAFEIRSGDKLVAAA